MEACQNSANLHVAISDALLANERIPLATRDLLREERTHWIDTVCDSLGSMLMLPTYNAAAQAASPSDARAYVLSLYSSDPDMLAALEQAFSLHPS